MNNRILKPLPVTGAILFLLILTGCSGQKEEDWLSNWPAQDIPQGITPVKGLIGEKHHL